MSNYSRMSYEELRRIADSGSIADSMSDEEYEALSLELWKKFGLEKTVRGREFGSLLRSLTQKTPRFLRALIHGLQNDSIVPTPDPPVENAAWSRGGPLR
jgi:hypothetical protein